MVDTAITEADALLDAELAEEEKPKNPYTRKQAWEAVWRHIHPLQKEVWVLILFGIFSAVLNGSVPYVTGKFFDTLILLANDSTPTWSEFPIWGTFLLLWAVLQLTTNITDWMMRNKQEVVWLKLRMSLEANSFAHVLLLPVAYHKGAHMGGTTNVISNAGWRISASVRNVTDIAPQLLSMLVGILLVTSIAHTLAFILLAGVVVYALILFFMLRHIAQKDDRAHRTWNKAWSYASSVIHSAETVKQAASEKHESAKIFHLILGRVYGTWIKLERHWGNVSFFQRIVVFATQLAVFVFSVGLIREHAITVGELVAVNGYALMFFGPLVELGHSWQTIQNGITSAVHLAELLDTPTEVYTPKNAVTETQIDGAVTFQNVRFRYEEGDPDVLMDISTEIHAGDVVAFVGESGGGKSTAIGLVSGYHFPTEGSVLVDGVDTRIYDLHALRTHIAIVPQEVTLWNDTIKNNIRYGAFDASNEDVARAAGEAHLAEFIATLPKGYDTLVGERGVKLSVGQKQRVAIARAILRNPKILILDEPTSALDAETEHYISEALARLMKGRTTLIIAHRLSTIRRANKILVLDKGRIAEEGTHAELVTKEGGIYRKLHDHQIGVYG